MNAKIDYTDWIGRHKTQHDCINATHVQSMAATLNVHRDLTDGAELPLLWHWILFNSKLHTDDLAEDGHAQKGDFLPPITLPRRMWAGGRIEFTKALRIGDMISRVSTIKGVKLKKGKSGELVFVTIEHDIRGQSGGCLLEEHEIVYRASAKKSSQASSKVDAEFDKEAADWSKVYNTSPVLLFRYSALTFNSHRIHYDRTYCQAQEGYPGLIVHGPLIATLLLELLREKLPQAVVKQFRFRALRPLFDHEPFSIYGRVEGEHVLLWARNATQQRAMEAKAHI